MKDGSDMKKKINLNILLKREQQQSSVLKDGEVLLHEIRHITQMPVISRDLWELQLLKREHIREESMGLGVQTCNMQMV